MSFVLVLLLTILALEVLRGNAGRLGLLSHPGAHRHHTRPTPLVGGIGMFIGLGLGVLVIPVSETMAGTFLLSGAVLVSTGIWDDRHEISFVPRFVAQAAAVAILAWFGDVSLRELGHIFAVDQSLILGRWGIALTIFAAVGVINAVNMSDGLDGLAGGLALVTCGSLLVASYTSGVVHYVPFISILIAALGAFLLFNVRLPGVGSARLYLGDAGSLLVGFLLAWLLIAMTQGETRAMAPVTALWVFALPLFDAVSALARRPLRGRSPFYADRTHYHHYLRDCGLSVNQTLLTSVVAAGALAAVGLVADSRGVPEHVMFYAFLALFVVYFLSMWYLDVNMEERDSESSDAVLSERVKVPGASRG